MTDVKVAVALLLVALSVAATAELASQRLQTASDLSLEPIRLGASDVEVVPPTAPSIPLDLGNANEVRVDRIISYSRSREYPSSNDTPPPSGR